MDQTRIEGLVRELLVAIGEDPEREGLQGTPGRVASSFAHLFGGYNGDCPGLAKKAVFTQDVNNMIVLRDIEVYSMCEHHMLPFFGRCHVAYISEGKVLGISKIARIVECYARRLQLQERLTEQIARAVKEAVDASGVGVVLECQHLCMIMRGVMKQESKMITSSLLGTFHDAESTRLEFLSLIGRA